MDLTISKSLSNPFTFSFSPDTNGEAFRTTLKVGYLSLGINLAIPFDAVIAIPVLVVNPTRSNSTLNGIPFVTDFTLKNLYP